MERANILKATIACIIGAVGSFIANLFGGWTNDLATLIIMMGIDFLTGLLIAAVWKKSEKSKTGALSSWSAWKGLCRKGVSLLFVLIAYRLDLALGVNYIRTAVIIGFIVNELISITENAGIMGIPIPGVIVKAIDMLKQKSEGDSNGN
ncbi:MAG: phage holin family protein [Lachnospiraceae bacterium]|jgi:toxin secretion/phage lysis holin|nr:phage holin family protein [Lachnospiraceae bacterium]